MEIVQTEALIKAWRKHHELDLKLIREGTHPKVYLLSRAEMRLVRDSMKEAALSNPLVWESAMKTLRDIYWINYQGYRTEIREIPQADKPLSYWGGIRLIGYETETYPEVLTKELKEAMILNKKLIGEETPPNGSVIEVKIDGHEYSGFIPWLRNVIRRTLNAIRKGTQKA